MKNIINYYYEFCVYDLKLIGEDYWFNYNNSIFCFHNVKYEGNLEYAIDLLKNIKLDNISTIILNKDNNIITTDGFENYVLLKIKLNGNRQINIQDILFLNSYYIGQDLLRFSRSNWNDLWSKKIDFFEYYLSQNPNINDEIKCLFHYFIGLGENAIYYFEKTLLLFGNLDFFKELSLCHNRIKIETTLYDFYNPFNFVIDYKVRDLCEYLKSMFLCGKYSYFDYKNVIDKFNYSKLEYMLLFSRLIFPTFFFDLLNDFEMKKISENQIIELYDLTEKFENFIKDIYQIICEKTQIPYISWLR